MGSLDPEAFEDKLREADIMFLPTRGENFGHAIYESLVIGTPVIISDQTPWKDLMKSKAGFDIDLQDQFVFCNAIQKFCKMDSSEYEQWSIGAREFALGKVDLEKIRSQYIRLFE